MKGKYAEINKDGKIGEHLHSDLAIVSTVDLQGFKYALTVVDEISDEVVVILLKDKTGDTVLEACKRSCTYHISIKINSEDLVV